MISVALYLRSKRKSNLQRMCSPSLSLFFCFLLSRSRSFALTAIPTYAKLKHDFLNFPERASPDSFTLLFYLSSLFFSLTLLSYCTRTGREHGKRNEIAFCISIVSVLITACARTRAPFQRVFVKKLFREEFARTRDGRASGI